MQYEILKKEFERIKKMGWIRAKKHGYGEAGMLFEELLGIKNNKIPYPDFYGIEIKTKYSNRIKEITLFNYRPKKEGADSIKYLLDNFGYLSAGCSNYKNLNVSLYFGRKIKIGKYRFGLTMDKRKIYVTIYDEFGKIIDNCVYWELEEIKERIEEKCKAIAYIRVIRYFKNGIVFYKYKNMEVYNYIDFDIVLKGIKENKLFIDLKISTIKKGENEGKIHNHGTAFRIMENDLGVIFKKK